MKMRKLCALSLIPLCATLFTSCGKGEGAKEGVLKISFYEGGFGREWLVSELEDFKAKKASQGVTIDYELVADANITTNVQTYITSGKNLSDIYMTQGNTNWPSWVTQGYLANLNDTYETEIEKLDGTKVKVKDYMSPEIQRIGYMKKKYGQGSEYPWIMPWSLLETSIIVNDDLLKATKKGDGSFYTEAPKTMDEMVTLFEDINKASKNNDYGLVANHVAPLSWAQNGINYFTYLIYVLWAQQQGIETSRVNGEGSFYDFWNCETPEVWKQTGIQKAIDEVRRLVTKNNDWANTVPNFTQNTFRESANAFCRQEAVFLLGGSFFENEMKPYLDRNGDGKFDFNFSMMNVPLSANALQKDGHDAIINYCASDDMMFVPAKATNLDLAKEFLAFMCNEKYLLDFSKKTGCLRPFEYDPVELTKNDDSVEWSPFFMSCLNMKKDADYNIFKFPLNAANSPTGVSPYYTYYKPDIFNGVGISTACLEMKNMTGKQIMVSGLTDPSESVYEKAKIQWNKWKTNMGL